MSRKKFARDIGIIGITQILVSLKGLLLLPLITKVLGEESYGIWVQIVITISLLSYLFTLGLPFSLVRFLPGHKDRKVLGEHVFSALLVILLITAIVSAVVMAISGFFASVLFGGRGDLVILLAAIIPFFSANLLFLNYFRARREMKKYSFGILVQTYTEVGLVYILIFGGFGLYEAVLSVLFTNMVLFISLLIVISKQIGVVYPSFTRLRELLDFGIPTIPSNFSAWIMQSSDRYLLAFFIGIIAVGVYSPAYTVGFMVSYVFAPLAFVLPPTLADMYDKKAIEDVRRYLSLSTKYLFFFAVPSFFGLSLFSRDILILLSTEKIANEGHMIVPLIAGSVLLWGLSIIYSQTIILAKRTKIIGAITVGGAAVNFVLNLLFIPLFGIMGAAVTTLIAYCALAGGKIYYSRRFLCFSLDYIFMFKVLISSIMMFIFLYLLNNILSINVLILLFMIGIGLIIYLVFMLAFKGIDRKIIGEISGLIRS